MKKINSIIFGNNDGYLFGSENDAILIYNLFYSFYKKSKVWEKPYIFLNSNVIMDNIIKLLNKNKLNDILIIYFSGHCIDQKLNFYNKKISKEYFYSLINNNLNNKINLYLILDCCSSSSFITLHNYNNFNKISLFAACDEKEESSETIMKYNLINYSYRNIKQKNYSKVIHGIFTYNFHKILKNKNLINIDEWNIIKNNLIWHQIKKLCGQTFIMKIKI